MQLFKERDNPDRLRLSINGQNIRDWFKQKYQELKQKSGVKSWQLTIANKPKGGLKM